jgi:adenylosuccinate synthase
MTKLSVVVGGQYGSEAKGHITAQLVQKYLAAHLEGQHRQNGPALEVLNIRVAGPNAGHSAVVGTEKIAFRQIPVGALYGADWAIAAGSEIDLPVLIDELQVLQDAARRNGIKLGQGYVDPEATWLDPVDKNIEASASLVSRLGSTGKGIGAARVARLMREPGRRVADRLDWSEGHKLNEWDVVVFDVAELAHGTGGAPYDHVIVEGTQGYGLGLHAGNYPQTTSSDCRAIDFLAMAGISPWHKAFRVNSGRGFTREIDLDVWVVARMYPIRVAGNSGPMKDEMTWEQLGLPEERTTVTQKIRRVGGWDADLVSAAIEANGGFPVVKLALTMVDQRFPQLAGVGGDWSAMPTERVYEFYELSTWFEENTELDFAAVAAVTTSDRDIIWMES